MYYYYYYCTIILCNSHHDNGLSNHYTWPTNCDMNLFHSQSYYYHLQILLMSFVCDINCFFFYNLENILGPAKNTDSLTLDDRMTGLAGMLFFFCRLLFSCCPSVLYKTCPHGSTTYRQVTATLGIYLYSVLIGCTSLDLFLIHRQPCKFFFCGFQFN